MSEWFGKIKRRVHNIDRDDALKWGFIVSGGLLAFIGNIFDQRRKDRLYKEQLPKEIEKQAKRIVAELKKEDTNA